MALKGRTKILKSEASYTQYVTIPSAITRDSQYPFRGNEDVEICVDPAGKIEIRKRKAGTK